MTADQSFEATGPDSNAAEALFDAGWYCAESVLLAAGHRLGIDSPLLPAAATGLCAGISRTGGICGAVTGAILAIGLAQGRRGPNQSKDEAYAATEELLERFEDEFGSTNCTELLGCHLGTPEGRRQFIEQGLSARCRRFTGAAYALALEVLEVDGEPAAAKLANAPES